MRLVAHLVTAVTYYWFHFCLRGTVYFRDFTCCHSTVFHHVVQLAAMEASQGYLEEKDSELTCCMAGTLDCFLTYWQTLNVCTVVLTPSV